MEMNQGLTDRIVRTAMGAGILVVVAYMLASPTAVIEGVFVLALAIFGIIVLLTGVIGWCPTYALLGLSTCASERRPKPR